jgi:hypothetical protein
MNLDPVSRLSHPALLSSVASADLETRRVVGSLLLAWSVDLAEGGDADAASLSRLIGEAIRP